jgi:hypothetical protein
MLDSADICKDELKPAGQEQLAWLEKALASSKAPWKIVALHQALFSAAREYEPQKNLAKRLLPLLDRYKVNLVAWGGGRWYERLSLPGHFPIFVNCGWSGDQKNASFNPQDPRLRAGYDHRAGFVLLSVAQARLTLQAVTDKGDLVDVVRIGRDGSAQMGERPAKMAGLVVGLDTKRPDRPTPPTTPVSPIPPAGK